MALIKPKRQLWVPSRPAIIPHRRPLPVVRPLTRRIVPITASVGFDTSGIHDSASANVSTLSNNFTIGAALSNGAMVGFLAVGNTAAQITGASMTWNAVSMGAIASTTIFDSGYGSLALFGLVAPTGGTHSLSASWTGAGPAAIGFWSFSGVDQTGGATTFLHGNTVNNGGVTASQTLSITTTSGNGTVAGWGAASTFSGTQTPTQDWQDNLAGGPNTEGQHILSSSGTSSFTAATTAADVLLGCGCDILATAGAAVIETNTHYRGRTYVSGWSPNRALFQTTAQDFSSPGVETNPHWRGQTWPLQWSLLRALIHNSDTNAPFAQPETNTHFIPRMWPLQWRPLPFGRTTAQDFSSFGVETNPHWVARTWPVVWTPMPLGRSVPLDVPFVPPDVPVYFQARTWPIFWLPLAALSRAPATDVPFIPPDTPTYFLPRVWPLQWRLDRSLVQRTAQDFSSFGIETNIHFVPKSWPLQWNLQQSLMRGTPQDFSTTVVVTGVHYITTSRGKLIVQVGVS